jgi:hypothetical protein
MMGSVVKGEFGAKLPPNPGLQLSKPPALPGLRVAGWRLRS